MSTKATNEELREIYNNIPKPYDKANILMTFNQDMKWRADLVKTILKYCEKPKIVLDVGGGMGELTYVFKKIYKRNSFVVISDYSENMLMNALVGDDRVLASFYALPFRDNAFDAVMSSYAVHAADDVETVIKEMNRVSKNIIAFISMGKPDNPLKRLVFTFYLKFVVPYIVIFVGGRPKDYKYLYYIYKKHPPNSRYKELFHKLLNVLVYEEKGFNLLYFVVAKKKT